MKRFDQDDAPVIRENGVPHIKHPNPVFLWKQDEDFEVETAEGLLRGYADDYVAHDPITGHVWVVSADYVAHHYTSDPVIEANQQADPER